MGGDDKGATSWQRRVAFSRAASSVRADITFALLDVLIVTASYATALSLRMLDPMVGNAQAFWIDFFWCLPVIATLHVVANALAGAYGHVWEYASVSEATRLVVANACATAIVIFGSWVARETLDLVVPYLSLLAGGLLTFMLTGLVRFRSRLFSLKRQGGGPTMVVIGNGLEAAAFARRVIDIENGGSVVGFVEEDDSRKLDSRLVADLPVLGSVRDIPAIVNEGAIDQVIIARSDPELISRVVDLCLDVDVRLRILPRVEDIVSDRKAPLDVRDIKVEDLLVRDLVATDLTEVTRLIEGKRVLVTGGGGSIGSEIVRQVLTHGPASVWALDRDETLLHEAQLTWNGEAKSVLCDIRDSLATLRCIEEFRPEIIFHAAALKHVPVLEEFPGEAVLTNVVGTRNVIEAGSRVGAERFVLISTDKAVDPTSVMGATKRVAELLVKAGNSRNDGCTYTAVRFGNVLGSRGSVVPTFVSQIRTGGPVTVTDPRMRRYFMTVDESVQLVLQAATLAQGSEVFLLDMGEPVVIDDLARRLIRLAGLIPDVDVKVEYTGVRPGEKLEEILANSPVETTSHPKIYEVRLLLPSSAALLAAVDDMEEAAQQGQTELLIEQLNSLAEGRVRESRTTSGLAL